VGAAVLAAGSEKAAAHCLGLSHSTVKHYLANARSNLGAETTAQLVWTLAQRLPEPQEEDGRTVTHPPSTGHEDSDRRAAGLADVGCRRLTDFATSASGRNAALTPRCPRS